MVGILEIFFEKCNNSLSNFKNYLSHNFQYASTVTSGLFHYGLELFLHYQETKKHENFKSVREIVKTAAKGIIAPFIHVKILLKNTFFPSYPKLHTNACGDFTMLAKEKWFELRGYPELEIFSFNIDSIILQMAYEDGLREKILKDPLRMYHMEHDSGWTPESSGNLLNRLKETGIPFLSYEKFVRLASKMHRRKNPMVSNKEGWGLGSETLPEVCIN